MTNDNQLVTRSSTELLEASPAAFPLDAKQTNPLVAMHTLLRGRYPLAITLAIVGLILGGVVGFISKKPEYQCIGLVNVSPVLPRLLYQTPENSLLPMFDQYVAKQVEYLRGRRVVDQAMADPEWEALGRGYTPERVAEFEDCLRVDAGKGSSLIRVMFTDQQPKAAAAAVKGVIRSYQRLYQDDADGGVNMLNQLQTLRQTQTRDLNDKNEKILSLSSGFGPSYLQQVYDYNLGELNKAETEVRNTQRQIVLAGGFDVLGPSTTQASPTTQVAAAEPARVPLEELADHDPVLMDLQRARTKVCEQIRLDSSRLGTNHPSVIEANTRLMFLDEQVKDRVAKLQRSGVGSRVQALTGIPGQLSVQQLRADLELLRRQHDDLRRALATLGEKKQQIERLRAEAAEVQDKLNATNSRIEQLTVEKSGRISVLSEGDEPFTPSTDPRRKLTILGALGVASAGVGFVMLLGFLDRRMRHIDAARNHLHQVERMLGVLPELPEGLADSDQSSSAAYCIHQIRAMLQIRQRATGHKVFSITSPSPGDGKTSLTIALGMSLASSGQRTIVVDCDLESATLSAKVCNRSAEEGTERNVTGDVQSALRGEPLDQCVRATGYDNLSLLPLRGLPAANVGRASPEAIRAVLDALAKRYDIVLIDCGPILGSIEAAIIAAEVDGVILVVSRNGNRTTAEAAVRLLRTANAEIEGIVFNRAEAADVARSAYHSSAAARSRTELPHAAETKSE